MGWELELARTTVGAFFGAGLAFASNRLLQRIKDERDNVIAGNLALQTIASRLIDVYQLRASFRAEIAKRLEAGPAPAWALAHRTWMTFAVEDSIDLKSLAFLLDKERSQPVMPRLHLLDIKYRDTCALVKRCSESAQEVQKAVSELLKKNSTGQWADAEKHLGMELTRRISDEFHGALLRVEQDPAFYAAVFKELRRELVDLYGPRIWNLSTEPPPNCSLSEIKPLPLGLATVVAQAPPMPAA